MTKQHETGEINMNLGSDSRLWEDTAETRVDEVHEQLRIQSAALQAAANGIVITDRGGNVIWANNALCRMTGYAAYEIMGHSTRMLKSGAHDSAFYSTMWKTISEGKVWNGDVINRRKDGSLYHEHMTITPVLDHFGMLENYIAIKQDVTEKRRQEQEVIEMRAAAEEASLAKSQLLSAVAHELRAPLTAIMGFAEMIQDQKSGELIEDRRQYAANILKSSKNLLALLANLMDVSRSESGKFRLDLDTVDPARVAQEIGILVKGIAFKKGLAIKLDFSESVPVIQADEVKLKQILYNLLSNAIRWTPEAGIITITLADTNAPAPGVLLEVRDTGPGIAPEFQPHIFKEFTHKPAPEDKTGYGLGLALTKRVVELHGGAIHVSSTGRPGEGAAFKVFLPLAPPAAIEP